MPAPSNYIVSGHVHGDADKAELEVTVYVESDKGKEYIDADTIISGEDLNDFGTCAAKIKNTVPGFEKSWIYGPDHDDGVSGTRQIGSTSFHYNVSEGSLFVRNSRDLNIVFSLLAPTVFHAEQIQLQRQQDAHLRSLNCNLGCGIAFLCFLMMVIAVAVVWIFSLMYQHRYWIITN